MKLVPQRRLWPTERGAAAGLRPAFVLSVIQSTKLRSKVGHRQYPDHKLYVNMCISFAHELGVGEIHAYLVLGARYDAPGGGANTHPCGML